MNYKTTVFLSIALGAVLLIAAIAGMRYMNPAPEGYRSSFETAKEQATPQPTQTATPKPTEEPFTGFYDTEAMTLKERIHTPEGFHREEVETDSFAAFMENYALYKDGKKVKLYDKTLKQNQDAHVAVLKMKLVEGDLQQCADSIIRLYAEYFYQNKMYDKISLSDESKKIKKAEIQAGDIFVQGGSPGHAVMVLDVCTDDSGRKAFLLGQGFMPAQQFHVLKNPLHEDDPWYYVDELTYPLQTPEYTFEKGSLKRPECMQ